MIYKYRFYSEPPVISKIRKTQLLDEILSQEYPHMLQLWIRPIDRTGKEEMTSGHTVKGVSSTKNPRGLSESFHWQIIRDILCILGLLVGADVPRRPEDIKSKSIVAAPREAANNQGRATTVIPTRLKKQNDAIRKQAQAITALKHHHVQEMIPQKGQAPPYSHATSRWQTFWISISPKSP